MEFTDYDEIVNRLEGNLELCKGRIEELEELLYQCINFIEDSKLQDEIIKILYPDGQMKQSRLR